MSCCEQQREAVGLFTDPANEYVFMLVISQPQTKSLMLQLTEQQLMTDPRKTVLFLTYKSLIFYCKITRREIIFTTAQIVTIQFGCGSMYDITYYG
jgi:hypothetical protein